MKSHQNNRTSSKVVITALMLFAQLFLFASDAFAFDSFFSGDIGIFGGIEYAFPFARGARLKIEYDPVDYNIEGLKKVKSQSRLNFGFVYPFNKHFSARFGMTKGNNLNFSFQYKLHNKSRESVKKKYDPPKVGCRAVFANTNKRETVTYIYIYMVT